MTFFTEILLVALLFFFHVLRCVFVCAHACMCVFVNSCKTVAQTVICLMLWLEEREMYSVISMTEVPKTHP